MRLRTFSILSLGIFLAAGFSVHTVSGAPNPQGEKPTQRQKAAEKKPTLWVIPSIHYEGAVFKTREEYLEIGLPIILEVLNMLKVLPNYRFALDQVCYVKPFLERYPEEAATFRQMVAEGRLEITGGTDTMNDVNMPVGESLVRQFLYGKGFYRDKLGVEVTAGWATDTFGQNAQMPQILKLAGYKSYWFGRGVRSPDAPMEFLWQGIDGTQIPSFWLPFGNGGFHPAPKNILEFERFAKEMYEGLSRFGAASDSDRVLVAGMDVAAPDEHMPGLVEEFNRRDNVPFMIRIAVPSDFEAAVAKRGDLPVVTGELNPVFQGTYSSRIEVKQWNRELSYLLLNLEKLNVLAHWLGLPTDEPNMARAWEPVLFNQAHDLMSGVMTDEVYEDTIRGYKFTNHLGKEMLAEQLEALLSKIDTQGEGIPLVVFNTLGWPRTDIVEVDVGLSEPGITQLAVVDPLGRETPVQLLRVKRHHQGGIRHARMVFVARDVPALGYSVYRAIPKQVSEPIVEAGSGREERWKRAAAGEVTYDDTGSIENEYYRATFDFWTGEMTSLVVKEGNWEVLRNGSGNVVAREFDGGDLWELKGRLGGSMVATRTKQPIPRRDKADFSNEQVGGRGQTRPGPVFSEFTSESPYGSGRFATTVRLYAGLRRVDITTEILNNDKFVRYRVLFPISIEKGEIFHEIPFAAIQRPSSQEFPAQNWIDYGDGTRGVALLNRGLPGNNVADGTMMLSLLRSAKLTAYQYFGATRGRGFREGFSDTGLQVGKQLTFRYALVPHNGDWREAGIYRAGLEFNNPLIARKAVRRPGILPKRWGLLEVSHPNVVVSALKPGRDGSAILRLYEAEGRAAAAVKIKLHARIKSAYEANLMEDSGRRLAVSNDTLEFAMGPFEIKTFKLQLRPLEPGN